MASAGSIKINFAYTLLLNYSKNDFESYHVNLIHGLFN